MSLDDKRDEFLRKVPEPKPLDNEIIRNLTTLKPIDYDRERLAKAKELGCRPAILDAEVKAARSTEKQTDRLPFPTVEPYPEPIVPAQLLNEVSGAIRQFIVLDEHQAHAAALWVAMTYFIDVLEVAPLAIINAPEKSCGKTQLLNVMGKMSYRPLPASNASASALFRAVELWKPTILIDEADTFFRDNAELHGMVNAGYLRGGLYCAVRQWVIHSSLKCFPSIQPKRWQVLSWKSICPRQR